MVTKTTNDLVTIELRRRVLSEKKRLREDAKGLRDTNYVYYLIEPEENVVRYVGVAQCVADRFASHISQCRKGTAPVAKWVRSLVERGELPRCEVAAAVHAYGGFFTQQVWTSFAVRALERAIVQHAQHGYMPSNLRNERFGGYRADLLNVEHLR